MKRSLFTLLQIAVPGLLLLECSKPPAAAEENSAAFDERLRRLERRMDELAQRQEQMMHRLGLETEPKPQTLPPSAAELDRIGSASALDSEQASHHWSPPPLRVALLHSLTALMWWLIPVCILAALWIFTDIRRLTLLALDWRIFAKMFKEPESESEAILERINDLIDNTALTAPRHVKLPWAIHPNEPIRIEQPAPVPATAFADSLPPPEFLRPTYRLALSEADCAINLWPDGSVAGRWLRFRGKDVEVSEFPPGLLVNAQAALCTYLVSGQGA